MQWTVVIPVKALPAAKSRLAPASADADAHRRLVRAIRADTSAAAGAAAGVARLLLVIDRADAPESSSDRAGETEPPRLVQHAPGLDAALREAAAHARAQWPDDGVAALVGDLPALRPDELADALRAAARYPCAFVPDADGTGTTLLTASAGHDLAPAFGPGSAARHARAAERIAGAPGLRRDVDTAADLIDARRLGVGPETAAALDAATTGGTAGGTVPPGDSPAVHSRTA